MEREELEESIRGSKFYEILFEVDILRETIPTLIADFSAKLKHANSKRLAESVNS